MGVVMMANKAALFVTLVGCLHDSKLTEASFSPNSTDMLLLQLTQVPTSPGLTIFVSTMTTTMILITSPLVHARRIIIEKNTCDVQYHTIQITNNLTLARAYLARVELVLISGQCSTRE